MKLLSIKRLIVIFSLTILSIQGAVADEIRIAVASNFSETIKQLSATFESNSPHKIKLIFGATGRHYAQIIHGAPFDIFFAADSKRPQLLDEKGIAQSNTRFTYAWGKLVLWSPKKAFVDDEAQVLERLDFNHLSIANPKLAPYGKAAQEFLMSRDLWKPTLLKKTVRGENIGQAFQFVNSGNADLGFVAYSQVKRPNKPLEGSLWEVPELLYTPIEQQVVLLKNSPAAKEFLCFIMSDEAQSQIQKFAYKTTKPSIEIRNALQCEGK